MLVERKMKHRILFTGHMIDAKDRDAPRFPPYKELNVRQGIEKHVRNLKIHFKNGHLGIAGGACGGDILFHELCLEMNIPSEIYLAMPIPQFKKESVSFAGKTWENRFDKLTEQLTVHILPKSNANDKSYNVWARANLWMLQSALKDGGKHMTLIALWDGISGDGVGGTEHMVKVANDEGAKVEIININKL